MTFTISSASSEVATAGKIVTGKEVMAALIQD
jgi:hypothetical protein